MKVLYSNVFAFDLEEGQESILSCIGRFLDNADAIDIAVGYVSRASLEELERLISEKAIRHVSLLIGMYDTKENSRDNFLSGDRMSRAVHNTAIRLHKKWQQLGIGEIRIVSPIKYHGKVYCFYKEASPVASVLGSANLSVLSPDAYTRNQYETGVAINEPDECKELAEFVQKLKLDKYSRPIDSVEINIRDDETNSSLEGIEFVKRLPSMDRALYSKFVTDVSFKLPLKAPSYADRFLDDNKHYTKSNINVCYAAPRSKRKSRDWYETQLTVSKAIRDADGYPKKNSPFFVITDDNYMFKAHTTSDGNKQFSAVGDELILGRWIKGRLAVAGLVIPVNDTQKDSDRSGMITTEMLDAYGVQSLSLIKTSKKIADENGYELDVWLLSFSSD